MPIIVKAASSHCHMSLLITARAQHCHSCAHKSQLMAMCQFTTDADEHCLCSGKFTWRMSNFGLFRDMIRVQKIMSPPFSAGDCSLRISVYQSTVGGKEHLSLCLESKVCAPVAPEQAARLHKRLYTSHSRQVGSYAGQ